MDADVNVVRDVTELAMGTLINISGMWALAWYRVHRKFKKERYESIKQFVEANWVEIVITVMIVPQWPDMIRAAFGLFSGS